MAGPSKDEWNRLAEALANEDKLTGKWFCEVDGCGRALPCRRHTSPDVIFPEAQR